MLYIWTLANILLGKYKKHSQIFTYDIFSLFYLFFSAYNKYTVFHSFTVFRNSTNQ